MAYRALILIVCSANLCRSPMAEHLLRRRIHQAEDDERLRVASAGTWADADEPAPAAAQQVMLEEGIDLSAHRSRALTQPDVDGADLILVMTRDHRRDILARFARVEGKLWLLTEMAGKPYDIADPYGGSVERYRQTRQELQAVLAQGYQRIARLALGLEVRPPKRRFRLF